MKSQDLDQVMNIERMSFSLPWPLSAYNYELNENPHSLLWVAETDIIDGWKNEYDKQIVGMIVLWQIMDEAHIASLAVHPDCRGRGIARDLLYVALKEAMRKGLSSATLEVRANNFAAQHLYHHFGFEIVGCRPRYYRDNNEDGLIMTAKHLDETYLNWLESGSWKDQPGEE